MNNFILKYKILLLINALIIIFCILIWLLDYRVLNLKYIGDITVEPDISIFIGNIIMCDVRKGNDIKRYINNEIFHPEAELILHKPYITKWDDKIQLYNNKYYYIGIKCNIEKISYFWHSKLFKYEYGTKCFRPHSVSLKKVKGSVLKLYEADELVVGL